jgi:tetratricopeptide (TPR) repeat protein
MNRLIALACLLTLPGRALAASFQDGLALKRQQRLTEAAAVFEELLAHDPQDVDSLEQWATLLGWQGRYDDAAAAWQRALSARPQTPRFQLGLARVRYWKGALQESRAGLEEVLRQTPADVDALLLAGDVSLAQRDPATAREFYRRARELDPSTPGIEAKLARAAPALSRRIDVGGTVDHYDNVRNIEGSFFAQVGAKLSEPLVVSAGYEELHWFGQVDHRINAGFYLQASEGLLLHARGSFKTAPGFSSSWEALTDVDLRLSRSFAGLFLVRHLGYGAEGVNIVAPGLRFEPREGFAIIAQGGAVFSTVSATTAYALGRVELQASDAFRFCVGVSRGDEAQRPLAPATSTTGTAGVVLTLPGGYGLRFDYALEDRLHTHVRNSLGSAVTARF